MSRDQRVMSGSGDAARVQCGRKLSAMGDVLRLRGYAVAYVDGGTGRDYLRVTAGGES